jgi:hypothetical protein
MSTPPSSQDHTAAIAGDIDILIQVKQQLEKIPLQQRSRDYTSILSQVNSYLYTYCKHSMDTDLIDLDPDRSIEIEYCTICGITLHE